jgi:hypothetical protein
MSADKIICLSFVLFSLLMISCDDGSSKKKKVSDIEYEQLKERAAKLEKLNQDYPRIPDEKILDNNGANTPVYAELKARYKTELEALKKEVEATGAKFVVVIITPEVGPGLSNLSRYGHPFIKSACGELRIELVDCSPEIGAHPTREITQSPRDGHWNKKGSVLIASLLSPIIKKYSTNKSKITYKDEDRPETFGDLPPNDDEILDGGKDMPYHVKANSQGLRMDHDIKFPKQKQHVLLLGGSQIFSPFLDNESIASALLEKEFPDAEIMNSGMISGTIDDYLSLFREKAKYAEPDLVIMQTNGGDITDLFFTNRNHLARSKKLYLPTPVEAKYYLDTQEGALKN